MNAGLDLECGNASLQGVQRRTFLQKRPRLDLCIPVGHNRVDNLAFAAKPSNQRIKRLNSLVAIGCEWRKAWFCKASLEIHNQEHRTRTEVERYIESAGGIRTFLLHCLSIPARLPVQGPCGKKCLVCFFSNQIKNN